MELIKEGKLLTDILWWGNKDLAERLNSEQVLKNRIITFCKTEKDFESIEISYFDSFGYAIIRTDYFKPTLEMFETMNMIAGIIKSVWFRR